MFEFDFSKRERDQAAPTNCQGWYRLSEWTVRDSTTNEGWRFQPPYNNHMMVANRLKPLKKQLTSPL